MIKAIFNKLNSIFLHDEDEAAPLSDYIWFYGFHGFVLIGIIFWTYQLVTF